MPQNPHQNSTPGDSDQPTGTLHHPSEAKLAVGNRGRWLIVLATIFWSMSGLFAKAPFLEQWPASERGVMLGFWRAVFASLALLPFIGRPIWSWRLVPAAIAYAIMNVTFLLAMSNTTAANAIWLQYTAPVWVFLVGTFLLGEKSVARDRWMVLCGMAGVAVILFFEWQASAVADTSRIGVVYGLMAGVAFAAVVLGLRQVRDMNPFYVIAICNLSSALLLLPFIVKTGKMISPGTGIWMAAFGILQMAVPYILFTKGLRTVPSHEASCITLLEPLLVPVWVFVFWRHTAGYELPRWWTLVGASLILTGLVVRYWRVGTREGNANTSASDDDGSSH